MSDQPKSPDRPQKNSDKISDKLQPADDGVGPLYHRTYELTFRAVGTSAEAMMTKVQANLNAPSAQVLATFEKVRGAPERLAVGDGYLIHITGPWNGPVRVVDVGPRSFRLATLEGHMEAGEISFGIQPAGEVDTYVFRIESRARSRDRVVDLVYDKIGIARAAQTEMWNEYCLAVAKAHGTGEQSPEVRVTTERRDEKTGTWERLD